MKKDSQTVAHCSILSSQDAINHFLKTEEVAFLQFEKTIETIYYSLEQAHNISNEIAAFIKPIEKIISW